MKVILWDLTGQAENWIAQEAHWERIEIAYKLGTDLRYASTILNSVPYECILTFANKQVSDEIRNLMPQLGINNDKLIFALNVDSWVEHFDFANYLLKSNGQYFQFTKWNYERVKSPVFMCSLKELQGGGYINYIGSSKDNYIMQTMYTTNRNWSKPEMNAYYYLAKKYYPNRKDDGYFLDSGANIGTTCIYFKKCLDKNMRILAFEPLKENYDFLRINLILNGIEEDVIVERMGLSFEKSEMQINKNNVNPGGSSFLSDLKQGHEVAPLVALDDYFLQHNLEPYDLKYMWIDTEGFEPQVLMGARSILESGNVPLYMEFNPLTYELNGNFEKLVNLLNKIYKQCIFMPEAIVGNEKIHSVTELLDYKGKSNPNNPEVDFQMDIFFIK